MLLAALLQLASAGPLAQADGPLEIPCGWGGNGTPTKDMTGLTLGYLYGYAEARGNAALWREQVQLAERIEAICRRKPSRTMKDIADEILREKGIMGKSMNGKQ